MVQENTKRSFQSAEEAFVIHPHASVLSAPLISTKLSCGTSASNLLGAVTNGSPVSAATCKGTMPQNTTSSAAETDCR
jgi:hypothetical protein